MEYEVIVTVVGRSRRVYSRAYKRNSERVIDRMAEHYRQKEAEKGLEEGFIVTGLTDVSPNHTFRVFVVQYAPKPEANTELN